MRSLFDIPKKNLTFEDKITALLACVVVMIIGLLLFKYMPQNYYGSNITFDASGHVTVAIFLLYIGWYFIDQNPASWRYIYLAFAAAVTAVVAVERFIAGAHDVVGVGLALIISLGGIMISRWTFFRDRIDF